MEVLTGTLCFVSHSFFEKINDPFLKINYEKRNAQKVIELLHRGIRFTPTQADVIRIEKLMMEEI